MITDADFQVLAANNRVPALDLAQVFSAGERQKRIDSWMTQLEQLGVLTGYDRNVLQQWQDAGYPGARPQLSIEINAPYREQDEEKQQTAAQRLIRQEQRMLDEWLRHGQLRTEVEQEQRLLRHYPISYPAFIRRQQELEQARKEALRAQLIADRERQKAEQLEREALESLKRQMEEDRRQLTARVEAYVEDPLGSTFDLTEGEFTHWCDEIATPEQLDALTNALAARGRYNALPPWQRWLLTRLAPLLA
jgi:hypothetical protein